MGLGLLILGLVIFLGAHSFVSLRSYRNELVGRMGQGAYKGLFSIVAAMGLVLVCYGFARYRHDGLIPVWSPPGFLRHVTEALMWPAFVVVVAAYIPGHIKRTLKHPMLLGVKLWASAHLLSNGDLGGIVLFGSILAWAGYARVSLKRRKDAGAAAIPADGWKNDALAVLVGTLVYLAVGFVFHPLAGVPVFGV